MKKNNKNSSQKKAKRHSKNLKRLSKKQGSGHYRNKFKQVVDLTPEQKANAEKALAESLQVSDKDLAIVAPWEVNK